MMQNVDNWETFVNEHLLQFGVVDGLLLITKRGEAVYSQGKLSAVERKYTEQFVNIFNASTSEQETAFCCKGFDLEDDRGKMNHFTIYHKTFCSVYCTSEHNKKGLIVCNLPYSVLIASYPCGQTNTEVIRIVENACKILRM
ncbi:uncharacterized protein LOC116303788 [Actinia tenebrosa]|uniref:Uncharacterized protein LOC116303788 n=1 Tax=Actinia tenebrosa TaxID=6105 RepID=A0A6P8ISD7_ACTTE|nr:uncharacterized protein LOC116303788 [Actinia tenebrosa]